MAEQIVVLGTGGTITGVASARGDNLGYDAGAMPVAELLRGIPVIAGLQIHSEEVARIDSKDMGTAVWRDLALRADHWLRDASVRAVVVAHGTDTAEETAYVLQCVLGTRKPLVLTCAMRPATAVSPDGPQNMLDAFAAARAPGAHGVVLVCAGTIHGARDVAKVHPYRLDAFSSGDAGPLGYVEEGAVRLVREWPQAQGDPSLLALLQHRWPRVEIVTSHAGADGRLVDLLLADGVQGLVVAGTGNGSVHEELERSLLAAVRDGVQVVRATRCAQGQVITQPGDRLQATSLSPVKARIELQLQLLRAQQRQSASA